MSEYSCRNQIHHQFPGAKQVAYRLGLLSSNSNSFAHYEPRSYRLSPIDQHHASRDVVDLVTQHVRTVLTDPVVPTHDATGELVHALRVKDHGFQPWVFADGEYEITIGEPESDRWQTRRVIASISADDLAPIARSF